MLAVLRSWLAPPVFPGDSEKTNLARLLYTILLVTLGALVGLGLIIFLSYPDPLFHLLAIAVWLPLGLLGLGLLRRGVVKPLGLSFVALSWLIITLLTLASGGIRASSFAGFIVVILLAGLVYGTRASLVTVAVSVLAGLVMLYAELHGQLPPQLLNNNLMMIWGGMSLNFVYTAMLVHTVTRNTQEVLSQVRRNERALQQSEANFRAVVENASDGIIIFTGADARPVYANQRITGITGYAPAELSLLTVRELIAPEEYSTIIDRYRQRLAGQPAPYQYETMARHKSGQVIPVEITMAGTEWQGQPATILIMRDVSERQHGHEALRRAEQRYREMFEEAPAMYVITRNRLGTPIIFDCNDLFLTAINYRRDEVIGRPLADFYSPEARAALTLGGYQRALSGQFTAEERQLITRDGRALHTILRARPESDSTGQVVGTRAMFVDITDRKQVEQQLQQLNEELSEANEQLQREIAERKIAEQALRQSEQLFRDVAENIREVFWVRSNEQVFYISPAYEAIWGRSCASFYQNPNSFVESVAPADRRRVGAALAAEQRHGQPFNQEYRISRPDGTTRWVWARSVPISKEDGSIRSVGIAEDITERKQMEERLATIYQLGQKLTLLHGEAEIARRVLEMAAYLLGCEVASCGLIDETTDELVYRYGAGKWPAGGEIHQPLVPGTGQPIGVLVVQSGQAIYLPDASLASQHIDFIPGSSTRAELWVPMRVGDWVVGVLYAGSTSPHYFKPADQQLLQTLADQTATALANARLYERLQRRMEELATLNEISQAITTTVDLQQRLEIITDYVVQLFDVAAAAVVLTGSTPDELNLAGFSGPDAARWRGQRLSNRGIVAWVVEHGEPALVGDVSQDARFLEGMDQEFKLRTRSILAVPLQSKGEIIGALAVFNKNVGLFGEEDMRMLSLLAAPLSASIDNARLYQDLQDRIEALRAAQAQLVQNERMAALGRLMASIAHEINNPLQAIQGFLSLLQEELAGSARPEKLTYYLGIAEQEIDRISNIVHRMREFYRPASYRPAVIPEMTDGFYSLDPTEIQAVDLHQILESVLQLANKKLQQGQVTVEQAVAEDLPTVEASSDHLKQVFLNLTLNAADAMQVNGGNLCIRMHLDPASAADDRLVPGVQIEFSDTGVGMAPDVLGHLFEPLFSTKEYGSGFGLFTIYQIITAHHGRITAASQLGQGTTFTIWLPLAQPH